MGALVGTVVGTQVGSLTGANPFLVPLVDYGSPGTPSQRGDTSLGPSVQSIPTTVAGVNALSGATFTEWWVCDASSGNLVGANGATLTAGGGSIRYRSTVPGWNGTDYTSGYRAVEFKGTNATPEAFAAGSASDYQLSQSVTWVFAARLARSPASTRGMIGNRAGSAATNAGYGVTIGTNGAPLLTVCDGTTNVNVNGPGVATSLDSMGNGALHWCAFKMDLTSGNATVFAYRATGVPVAMPAGTKTSATPLRIGGQPVYLSCDNMQIVAFGVLLGADAEAFGLTQLNALDNWCRPPSCFGSTHTRYHVAAPIVGSDSYGVRVQMLAGSATTTAKTDFAHAYAAGATSTAGIGILRERGVVVSTNKKNLLLDSDDPSTASWTKTTITVTSRDGESPAGFYDAAKLAATAGNATLTQNFTGTASTEHTCSVFLKSATGSNVAARLSLYDSSGPTEIAGTNITVTTACQRFSVSGTPGAITTLQWRLTITTNGDSVHFWGAQAEYKWLSSYMPQRGTSKDRYNMSDYIDNTSGQVYDPVAGRVEVTCTGFATTTDSTGDFVFDTACGASFEDRSLQQREANTSTYPTGSHQYDSAGVLVAQLVDYPALTYTDEITYAHEYDSRAPIPGRGVQARDEVGGTIVTTGPIAPSGAWTVGSAADKLYVGMRNNRSSHLEGIVTRVRTWGRQR